MAERLRLLCIANSAAYENTRTDIPRSYLALAADPRIELFHAETDAAAGALAGGGEVQAVRLGADFSANAFARLHALPTERYLSSFFDVAFDRTLKPFPDGFIDALVGLREAGLRFVNDPRGIRTHLAVDFLPRIAADALPSWAVTRDPAVAEAFLARHGDVVIKQPNSCGGRGVYRFRCDADGVVVDNLQTGPQRIRALHEWFPRLLGDSDEPLLLMRFLPRVVEGDTRVIVVDGEIYGAYLRQAPGHWVQNLSVGGQSTLTDVGAAERQVIAETSEAYRELDVFVLGYDFIRDDGNGWRVSEINAGNIGGIVRLEDLGVPRAAKRFADWLVAKFLR